MMIKNSYKIIFFSLILFSLVLLPVFATDKANKIELIDFIKMNTWQNVINNTTKDEEFQILVSLAKEKEILQLRTLVDSSDINQKILAIRALGLIKDKDSSGTITHILLSENNPELLYMSAWSLINLGGERNFYFVADNFKRIEKLIQNEDQVYTLLISLCENYKSKSVIKLIADYLNVSQFNIYKPVFLFTVFGRNLESEQLLTYSVGSNDKKIKLNATQILGRWYASPNAVLTFEMLLKSETDKKLRKAIIIGLEKISTLSAKKVLENIVNKSSNEEEKAFAQQKLNNVNKLIQEVKDQKAKNYSPKFNLFKQELSKLMHSKGFYGSYDVLEKNAAFKDIAKLELLRETIMLSLSEDATVNYDKVTRIIAKLHVAGELKK